MSRSKQPGAYADVAARTFLFAGIAEQELVGLLGNPGVSVAHYASGEAIFTHDENPRRLGIVLFGEVSVEKRAGERRMPMSRLGPGDLFGAAAMFCEQASYVADITALSSVWTLLMNENALRSMMLQNIRVAENYLRYLTGRIRFLSDRLDGFAESSVEARVLQYIRTYADNGVFSSKHARTRMADALCISRATLYRAFDALEDGGSIRRDNKNIVICEEHML